MCLLFFCSLAVFSSDRFSFGLKSIVQSHLQNMQMLFYVLGCTCCIYARTFVDPTSRSIRESSTQRCGMIGSCSITEMLEISCSLKNQQSIWNDEEWKTKNKKKKYIRKISPKRRTHFKTINKICSLRKSLQMNKRSVSSKLEFEREKHFQRKCHIISHWS